MITVLTQTLNIQRCLGWVSVLLASVAASPYRNQCISFTVC